MASFSSNYSSARIYQIDLLRENEIFGTIFLNVLSDGAALCSTVSDNICNIKEQETGHSYNLDRSIDGVFSTEEAHEYCCILETQPCNDVKEWFHRGEVRC